MIFIEFVVRKAMEMDMTRCFNCMGEFDNSITSICPHCGYDQESGREESLHLEPGTILQDRYIIGKALGSGGFGITYTAWDKVLNQKVAIKEYLPSELATRMIGTTEVCAYDGEKTYQFKAGLQSFVDEALRLVKFNSLDGIVHVFDSFISNSTAYIIMEFIDGESLKDMLKRRGPIPYQEVIELVIPALYSLEEVHKENIIHRDIAPDNIMKTVDGNVKLIDFGAARNATTVHSRSLSIVLKPGYAPEEQYRSHGNQGPWTDVYAMAAVMYHMITGKLPEESQERLVNDTLKTPTELGFVLPVPLENAIMNALNVKAEYRIQTAKEFADALSGAVSLERVKPKKVKDDRVKWTKKMKIAASTVAVIAVISIIAIIANTTGIRSFSVEGQVFPNLTGADQGGVEDYLKNIGLGKDNYKIVGVLENVAGDPGTVVWQDIEPGLKLTEDDEGIIVELKMAKEEVTENKDDSDKAVMPTLTAMTKNEARSALEKAGFTNITFSTKVDNSFKEGVVCDQSVKAKKTVDKNKKITVYIAKNDTTTTTEKTTTKSTTEKTTEKKTTEKKTTEKTTEKKTTTTTTTKATTHKSTAKPTQAATSATVNVPNVSGQSSSSGQSAIRSAGLFTQTRSVPTDNPEMDGIIRDTSPAAGASVNKGSAITVYVYHYEGQ